MSEGPVIRLYTTEWCGFCVRAKSLLEARGLAYEEVHLDDDPAFRRRLMDEFGAWTVPQVTVGGKLVGGYQELYRLAADGRLEELVAAAEAEARPAAA